MKKQYMIPMTSVVKIETQNIMAASLGGLSKSGGNIDIPSESAVENSDALSRGYDFWDDEEDEY